MARLQDTDTEHYYEFRFGRKDIVEVMVELPTDQVDKFLLSCRRRGECMWKPMGSIDSVAASFFSPGKWRSFLKDKVGEHYGLPQLPKANR